MDYRKLAEELCSIHYEYIKHNAYANSENIWKGEIGVLVYLLKHGEDTQAGDLSEALSLTTGRIANILKSLEQKKYIDRRRSIHDKRNITVSLTDTGRTFATEKYEYALQEHICLLEQLGTEDAKEYIRLNQKLLNAIK